VGGHLAGPLRCGIDAVCAWQIRMSYSMAAGMDDDSEIETLKVIDRAAGTPLATIYPTICQPRSSRPPCAGSVEVQRRHSR